jgi:hypothetical protein
METDGANSNALSSNPKDVLGVNKVSLSKLPPIAELHTCHALMNGADKYGPYNWRDKSVKASIYIDACRRHLNLWFEGEEFAPDSGAHHLGHAMACLAILIDAQEIGNLIDDRPITKSSKNAFSRTLERLNESIKASRS